MKLFFDIGNTRTKWVAMNGGLVVERGVVNNTEIDQLVLADHYGLSCAWASCVGQEALFLRLAELVLEKYALKLHRAMVEARVNHVFNGYIAQDRLGVDRWLAALGARQMVPVGDIVVIDAGTAVTVDLVTAAHRFEGGVIMPGASMMNDALVGRTAGIMSERGEVASVIGKTTQECVNAGALYGLAGAIERVVLEMQNGILHADGGGQSAMFTVLLCGGDAPRLASVLPSQYQIEPDLVFYGLQLVERSYRVGNDIAS